MNWLKKWSKTGIYWQIRHVSVHCRNDPEALFATTARQLFHPTGMEIGLYLILGAVSGDSGGLTLIQLHIDNTTNKSSSDVR